MQTWWSNHSVSLALCLATGVRAVQSRAVSGAQSLASPARLRHAQEKVVRLIAVVAGH
jgi:hypothetical protein